VTQEKPWRQVGSAELASLRAVADPVERALAASRVLEALKAQTEVFYAERIKAVAELRAGGMSYETIGSRLRINRQRAAQLYRDAVARGLVRTGDRLDRARPRS